MGKSNQTKYYWQRVLGIFAIISAVNTIPSEAIANPYNSTELYLAQVGVRSRINSPTPINLRPRHHIPLPSSSRSSRYNRRYNRYRDRHYSNYGDEYYRNRRSNRRDYCHHHSNYDCDTHGHRHRDDYEYRSRKRKNRGSITIYF